jgi:hypothetical protein
MNRERPGPEVPVPVLTEVIGGERSAPATAAPPPAAAAAPTEAVLARVQARVAALLEQRLRESLAAALAQATDTAFEQTRTEVGASLRIWVAEAVAQEMLPPSES